MPIRVPCRLSLSASQFMRLRARESNHGFRAYETRPSTGPPAKSQAPVSNRASRPYESRPDTCHAWGFAHFMSEQKGEQERVEKERELMSAMSLTTIGHGTRN